MTEKIGLIEVDGYEFFGTKRERNTLRRSLKQAVEVCRDIVKAHNEERDDLCRDAGMMPPYGVCDCDICKRAEKVIESAVDLDLPKGVDNDRP